MRSKELRIRILELGLVKRLITSQGFCDQNLTIFLLAGVICFPTNVAFAANGVGRGNEDEEKYDTKRHNHQRRFGRHFHCGRRHEKLNEEASFGGKLSQNLCKRGTASQLCKLRVYVGIRGGDEIETRHTTEL